MLAGCFQHHYITTDTMLNDAKLKAVNIMRDYGYVLDSTTHGIADGYYYQGRLQKYNADSLWYLDTYYFHKGDDTAMYTVKYAMDVTINDIGQAYVEDSKLIKCTIKDTTLAKTIEKTVTAIPKKNVKVLTEEGATGMFIGIPALLVIIFFAWAAYTNTH